MKIWRSLAEVPAGQSHPVYSIGNFDGVHTGHLALLEAVRRRAAEAGGTPLVLTFDPHPTHIVAPSRAPRLLTPLPRKLDLLRTTGIAGVLVLPFTLEVSRLSPEKFAREVLAGRLGAKEIMVGDNFRFGHRHSGDIHKLTDLGREMGFAVHAVPPVQFRGEPVGSSRIRRLLGHGDVSLANRLLGRRFSVRGRIVPGRRIGRERTVPTLNLEPYDELLPARGVYITETACGAGSSPAPSVTNIGLSPTFDVQEMRVESFLLEAPPPPGVREMEVIFWRRLRDERVFPSPEALRDQIMRDVARARSFFRRLRKPQPTPR